MVSTTKDKHRNFPNGFCHCKAFGLLDPSHTKAWFVLGQQGKFRRQTQGVASNTTDEEADKLQDLQLSCGEHNSTDGETQSTQDALPSVVNFQGVTGLSASKINGVYRCKTKKHPTKPGKLIEDKKIFYRHQSQSGWRYDSILLNDSEGRWMVLQNSQVLAYCELPGLADPCDAKRWHIANASKSLSKSRSTSLSSFTLQLSVDVKRAEEDRLDLLVRTKPSFHSPIIHIYDLFASTPKRAAIFANTYSDAKGIEDAPRKRLTFSVGGPIKKKITPYMKALERLKSRNRKTKIHPLQ